VELEGAEQAPEGAAAAEAVMNFLAEVGRATMRPHCGHLANPWTAFQQVTLPSRGSFTHGQGQYCEPGPEMNSLIGMERRRYWVSLRTCGKVLVSRKASVKENALASDLFPGQAACAVPLQVHMHSHDCTRCRPRISCSLQNADHRGCMTESPVAVQIWQQRLQRARCHRRSCSATWL